MKDIKKIIIQQSKVEDRYNRLIYERDKLFEMISPYISKNFLMESTYIDRMPGDGVVMITEFPDGVSVYPFNQIIDLISRGVTEIHRYDLVAI